MDEQRTVNDDSAKSVAFDRKWFKKKAERIQQITGVKITLDYERDALLKKGRYYNGLKSKEEIDQIIEEKNERTN